MMAANPLDYLRDIDINKILSADYSDAWGTIVSALRDPQANIQLAILIFVIVTLLIVAIFVGVLAFVSGTEDEEELIAPEEPVRGAASSEADSQSGLGLMSSPWRRRLVVSVVWISILALTWVSLGWVTSRDSICVDCHSKSIHTQASKANSSVGLKAHQKAECVTCHESASILDRYGWATASRSEHFVRALYGGKGSEYGTVGTSACLSCHSAVVTKLVRDERRGLKMSHRAPTEAGASCLDCHPLKGGDVAVLTGGMTRCVSCHNGQKAATECKTCHSGDISAATGTDKSEIPVRELVGTPNCGGCHNLEKSCDPCHGIRMPHDGAFLAGGHARAYVESLWHGDGKRCVKCHTDTRRSCRNCHQMRFPGHAKTLAKDHQVGARTGETCNNCHTGTKGSVPGRNMCIDLCHTDHQEWRTQ